MQPIGCCVCDHRPSIVEASHAAGRAWLPGTLAGQTKGAGEVCSDEKHRCPECEVELALGLADPISLTRAWGLTARIREDIKQRWGGE